MTTLTDALFLIFVVALMSSPLAIAAVTNWIDDDCAITPAGRAEIERREEGA